MYQPRRAAVATLDAPPSALPTSIPPSAEVANYAASAAAFVRPRRAVRNWRMALADQAAPLMMTLATAATIGSLMVASAAATPAGAVPGAVTARSEEQPSRSNLRTALVEEVPQAAADQAAEIAIVATRTMYAEKALTVKVRPTAKSKQVGTIKLAAPVHATPQTSGDYRLIEYKGELAWVLNKNLSAQKVKKPDAAAVAGAPAATRSVPGGSVLGLKPVAMVVYRAVMARWNVPNVGGYRAHSLSVHQFGRAIDFMVYNDRTMGNAIAAFLIANAKQFKVDHIIYLQRIWTPSSPYWRHMTDRGSPTANHMDHVHVAVRP